MSDHWFGHIVFYDGNDGLARTLTAKKQPKRRNFGCRSKFRDPAGARPPKLCFGGAGIPLKNKYLFIPATLNKMPDGIAKNDSPAKQEFF